MISEVMYIIGLISIGFCIGYEYKALKDDSENDFPLIPQKLSKRI